MSTSLYEEDFYAWTEQTAEYLRQRKFECVDLEALIDEVESLGRRHRRGIENRAAVLVMHLLKWQYQPMRRSRSWKTTIGLHRFRVSDRLEESPSLRRKLEERWQTAVYRAAVVQAQKETGLDCFPIECPYSIDQALDTEFWPE